MVGYVEDLCGEKQGQGRPRWRARYRDPSGRERSKSFARKVDGEQFLVSIEDAKLRGASVDPQLGRVLVENGPSAGIGQRPISSRRRDGPTANYWTTRSCQPSSRPPWAGSIRWRSGSGSPGWSS